MGSLIHYSDTSSLLTRRLLLLVVIGCHIFLGWFLIKHSAAKTLFLGDNTEPAPVHWVRASLISQAPVAMPEQEPAAPVQPETTHTEPPSEISEPKMETIAQPAPAVTDLPSSQLTKKQTPAVKKTPVVKKKPVTQKNTEPKTNKSTQQVQTDKETMPAHNNAGSSAAQATQTKTISAATLRYKRKPRVQYPEKSRVRKEQGVVHVQVTIDTSGNVKSASISRSSGFPLLDQAALVAVRRSSYHPYRENGQAFSVIVTIPIEFSLTQ